MLNQKGSQNAIGHLNTARSNMQGINNRPLPHGDVIVHPNGSLLLNAEGGRHYGLRPNGTLASYSHQGQLARFGPSGHITSFHSENMEFHRSLAGPRIVTARYPNHSVLVSVGPHHGYLERPLIVRDRPYFLRTYVRGPVVYSHVYLGYAYAGVPLHYFVAPVYYSPAFYGWASYPWVRPVPYSWGWSAAPWYGGPQPYFVASPVYPNASFWLTDYYLGDMLNAAYQQQADAGASDDDQALPQDDLADLTAPDDPTDPQDDNTQPESDPPSPVYAQTATPISAELKAAIADEIHEQLAYDNAAQALPASDPNPLTGYDSLPATLKRPNYIFVVADPKRVLTSDNHVCKIDTGDTLRIVTPPPPDATVIWTKVASSREHDCPAGAEVSVNLDDLQSMVNNLREHVETGLNQLRLNQGNNGLPAPPLAAVAAPPRQAIPDNLTKPDAGVQTMLQTEQQQANQAATQIQNTALAATPQP